jgi:hypothetical protein
VAPRTSLFVPPAHTGPSLTLGMTAVVRMLTRVRMLYRLQRMDAKPSPIEALADRVGAEWPNIAAARARTLAIRDRLHVLSPLVAEDTSIILFGSIGRQEVTESSVRADQNGRPARLRDHVLSRMNQPPLDLLARMMLTLPGDLYGQKTF